MILDDAWWCLMTLDDTWWRLMTLDDAWWCLMALDDTWWCLMTLDEAWWHLMTPYDAWFKTNLNSYEGQTDGRTGNANPRVTSQLKMNSSWNSFKYAWIALKLHLSCQLPSSITNSNSWNIFQLHLNYFGMNLKQIVKLGSRSKVYLKSLIRDLDLELVAIIAMSPPTHHKTFLSRITLKSLHVWTD